MQSASSSYPFPLDRADYLVEYLALALGVKVSVCKKNENNVYEVKRLVIERTNNQGRMETVTLTLHRNDTSEFMGRLTPQPGKASEQLLQEVHSAIQTMRF